MSAPKSSDGGGGGEAGRAILENFVLYAEAILTVWSLDDKPAASQFAKDKLKPAMDKLNKAFPDLLLHMPDNGSAKPSVLLIDEVAQQAGAAVRTDENRQDLDPFAQRKSSRKGTMIELLILDLACRQERDILTKDHIFDALLKAAFVDDDGIDAVAARLSRLQEKGLLSWRKNERPQDIKITDLGRNRAKYLRSGGIPKEDRELIEQRAPWVFRDNPPA